METGGIVAICSALVGGGVGGLVANWFLSGLEARVSWLERHDNARAPKPSQDQEEVMPDEYTDWDWPVM